MIAFVNGLIDDIQEDNIVLEVGGFGVNIRVSQSTAATIGRKGDKVKLFTFTHVKEDAFLLYGFKTKDELELFRQLLTVNGVGPKGALAVLSSVSANDLRFAIAAGDYKTISRAPGIGKRTAERIVLDLRDKITADITSLSDGDEGSFIPEGSNNSLNLDNSVKTEVMEALMALGYSGQEAMKAISKVTGLENLDSGTLLKEALKNIY